MIELLNHIARLWWDWTASMFWQVGLLILVIAAIDLLIRKWAWPQLRYALWSLILVKLLLPPTWSLPSSIVPELQPRVAQVLQWLNSEEQAAAPRSAAIADFGLRIADLNLNASPPFGGMAVADVGFQPWIAEEDAVDTDATLASNPQSEVRNPQLHWQFYALAIWSLGTLILGIWLFFRLHSVAGRQGYQAAAASLPQSFYNHLADCAQRLGLRRIPRVAVTKRLTSPAVFGVFAPVLLMPRGYLSKLSRRDTEHMLLHELAHIKRGDLVMHSLYMLLQIVYWYNPLLWLVRRHMHHLRELSCDGTVAELLRERTLAYRQTLLETARRMLTTSPEPGLGLLGLFEDSNHLLVRLNWLTKPTWRYSTMKRAIVATIALLMFACVLPMAQGQEPASNEATRVNTNEVVPVNVEEVVPVRVEEDNSRERDQLSQDIAALQRQLEQLKAQERDLQNQLKALAEQRNQMRAERREPRAGRESVRGRASRERAEGETPGAPREPRAGRGGGAPGGREAMPPEAREQVRRAQEQAQQWEQWTESEPMKNWERDMEKWGQQMERWGQEFGRRLAAAVSGTDGESGSREMPPTPPMPAMPAMPALPPMPPAYPGHALAPGAPGAAEVHMPVVSPPAAPEVKDNREEVVSRLEQTVDLAPGQLLEVANEIGAIDIRGSEGPGCKIFATVKAKADTMEEAKRIAEQIKLIVTPSDDKVRISLTKPERENRREGSNYQVTLDISVPRKVQLKVTDAVGNIHLTNLRGDIDAAAKVGSIQATDVAGRVTLTADVGSIGFFAPREFSARVQAKAAMGSVQSDFPLDVVKPRGVAMGSSASGTIGDGDGEVSLKTNVGSIGIRSQDAAPGRAERRRAEPGARPESRSGPRPEPRPQPRPEREL